MNEKQMSDNRQMPYPYQNFPNYYPQPPISYYPQYYPRQFPQQSVQGTNDQGMLPMEQSYIENILRMNKGKQATVYMTFENNEDWNAKVFKGIIEAAGRDHIILSDPESGKRYLLLMVYLDYITFDEEINYSYPYDQSISGQYSSYPPR